MTDLRDFIDGQQSSEATGSVPQTGEKPGSSHDDLDMECPSRFILDGGHPSRHPGITSHPVRPPASITSAIPEDQLPSTPLETRWDPVPRPFVGEHVLVPLRRTSSTRVPSGSTINLDEVAYLLSGERQYRNALDGTRLRVPRSYSKFSDFTPYVGAHTLTAEKGAIGINAPRLELMIRAINGGGSFRTADFTVYGCGPAPALITSRDHALLVELTDVSPLSDSEIDHYQLMSGAKVPEELPSGRRALDRIDRGLQYHNLDPVGFQQNNSGQITLVADPSLADPDAWYCETNPMSDHNTLVSFNTEDVVVAARGYGTVDAMFDALEDSPLSEGHLNELPTPEVTIGEPLPEPHQSQIRSDLPAISLSISYQPPQIGGSDGITRQRFGFYLVSVLTATDTYSEKFGVETYHIAATATRTPQEDAPIQR